MNAHRHVHVPHVCVYSCVAVHAWLCQQPTQSFKYQRINFSLLSHILLNRRRDLLCVTAQEIGCRDASKDVWVYIRASSGLVCDIRSCNYICRSHTFYGFINNNWQVCCRFCPVGQSFSVYVVNTGCHKGS